RMPSHLRVLMILVPIFANLARHHIVVFWREVALYQQSAVRELSNAKCPIPDLSPLMFNQYVTRIDSHISGVSNHLDQGDLFELVEFEYMRRIDAFEIGFNRGVDSVNRAEAIQVLCKIVQRAQLPF